MSTWGQGKKLLHSNIIPYEGDEREHLRHQEMILILALFMQ